MAGMNPRQPYAIPGRCAIQAKRNNFTWTQTKPPQPLIDGEIHAKQTTPHLPCHLSPKTAPAVYRSQGYNSLRPVCTHQLQAAQKPVALSYVLISHKFLQSLPILIPMAHLHPLPPPPTPRGVGGPLHLRYAIRVPSFLFANSARKSMRFPSSFGTSPIP